MNGSYGDCTDLINGWYFDTDVKRWKAHGDDVYTEVVESSKFTQDLLPWRIEGETLIEDRLIDSRRSLLDLFENMLIIKALKVKKAGFLFE